jgi:hypothetical protein
MSNHDKTLQDETLGFWEAIPENDLPNHRMVLNGGQLAEHWRRCSLTADFWSRYIALYVPADAGPERVPRAAMMDILSYLLNELFENCAKFSAGSQLTVHYQSWRRETEILIQLTNHIQPAGRKPFRTVIQEILDGDPDELYFQKLEASVRFRPIDENSVAVDVQAHVATLT